MSTLLKNQVIIRPLAPTDSLAEITSLLHRAYKSWANQGLNYLASYQDIKTTKRRAAKGQCFVATLDDRIVGTITYYPIEKGTRHAWYCKSFVAKYGQFAVEPSLQKSGIGSKLIHHVETLATRDGFAEIAIDTAEQATALVNYYQRKAYRIVDHAQWKETNFRSVLLSKSLRSI